MAGMNVCVASRNSVKLRAVRDAFAGWFDGETIDVYAIDPDESIPEQPLEGDVALGAMARAEKAIESSGADWGVGIEAGLVRLPGCSRWVSVQICAIADRNGCVSVGLGPGFELPDDLREAVLSGVPLRDALCELRAIDDGDRSGAICVLSSGRIDRYEITVTAVLMTLTTASRV
jgi:inosine/xanthosine triphosphatase